MEFTKPRIEACFSPREFHQYEEGFELIVVIDVLRATSAICTAIEHGVKGIIPVDSVEEARDYLKKGYIAAAEREGKIVEGFPIGNSPFTYMNPEFKGETIVLTTTNGTKAIKIAQHKETVVIGALNNLDSLTEWLIDQNRNVLILASGWKDKFNLEDTICAGAIIDGVLKSGKFISDEDSSVAAKFIYKSAKENIFAYLKASSHRRRLRRLNLNADVKYCLTPNNLTAIPILKDGILVALKHVEKAVES
ncbi:MAG TPA: 2-phosphosulfolactate phosphatase [Flavobacteriales bacterium]|nr:2-phosphosulfolactate phosphatase [Flavobacteriales bacterium]HHZ96422.1 2-phosphosulfolactate phosphatase [Flavobacteriales bacterium]HIB77118.1 2-phosphosulfolactate phosphatase [Flavobacteriales bacterium]HIN41299.1 2-phosphosulfolactate phosphatase [Flavobacteriales bacterium]HIO16295.1 2-phosphosulfolactate phosphatase [Flavobacteriales bacterium]